MVCRYELGVLDVRSDNLAALATMRDVLAKFATASRHQVRVSVTVHPEAAAHLCQVTWPRLEYLRSLESKGRLMDALIEIRDMDGGVENLSAVHQVVLNNQEAIREQLAELPVEMRYFRKMVCDLHVAFHRFQGGSAPKAAQLRLAQSLEDISAITLDDLIDIIQSEV